MGRGSARAGCKVNQPSSNLKPTQTAFLSYQFHSHLVIINVRYLLNIQLAYVISMFWKLSSLQNVEEGRVVPYCKGGLVTEARTTTRTHKQRCAQGSVEILVMRGEGPTSYNSSLSLSSPVCAAQRNTLKSARLSKFPMCPRVFLISTSVNFKNGSFD